MARRLAPLRVGPLLVDPPVFLAPIAGITTPSFRRVCEELGAGFTFTERVSVPGLVRNMRRVARLLVPSSRPFGVQFVGARPDEMERACRMAASAGPALVDVNMGCPARKILKSGAGAALMLEPDRAAALLEAARRGSGGLPVTAKIRSGWDGQTGDPVVLARRIEAAGAAWIAIHGRTRRQLFAGPVDLEAIRRVVEAVSVPVIANGGIFSVLDAERMVAATGCAGVMVARGALGRPWIFRELAAWARGEPIPPEPDLEERREILRRHLELALAEQDPFRAVVEFRKHLAWYSKGLPGAAAFRRRVFSLTDPEEVERAIQSLGE